MDNSKENAAVPLAASLVEDTSSTLKMKAVCSSKSSALYPKRQYLQALQCCYNSDIVEISEI
jgi:hypothetical protein